MRRRLNALLLAGFGVAAGGAALAAAGWSEFDASFPGLPCMDGWAACIVSETVVTPGMVLDGSGRPHPSDQRIGFFDFEPLPSFDPFSGLSKYTGDIEAQRQAAARPAAPPRPSAERPAADRGPSERGPSRPGGSSPSASSAPSSTSGSSLAPPGQRPPPGGSSSAPAAAAAPTAVAPTAPSPTAPSAAPPAASSSEPATCDNLIDLEAPALMGELGVGRRKCLEDALKAQAQQTMKGKISRLLISDASARGDKGDWEKLMKRHLEDIDRSDPDMCMAYAIQLSKGGAGRANGVIRWSDYALENKHVWPESVYKKKVYGLYKLRARAAGQLWEVADKKYVEERTDENDATASRARGQAKDFSREWLDYARASQQDTKEPLGLCVSAAGSKEFCEQ